MSLKDKVKRIFVDWDTLDVKDVAKAIQELKEEFKCNCHFVEHVLYNKCMTCETIDKIMGKFNSSMYVVDKEPEESQGRYSASGSDNQKGCGNVLHSTKVHIGNGKFECPECKKGCGKTFHEGKNIAICLENCLCPECQGDKK